ncbi:MAG: hypothetical protein KGL39_12730 [Patescibacteria group bacterium]|nr:hypothetical protein [Patescibacteria group bacterium]
MLGPKAKKFVDRYPWGRCEEITTLRSRCSRPAKYELNTARFDWWLCTLHTPQSKRTKEHLLENVAKVSA